MGRTFDDWPPELLIQVLSNADLVSILRCKQTCKRFKTIISESVQLQYNIELAIGGLVDGTLAKGDDYILAKRLDALRTYREAWMSLTPRIELSIKLPISLSKLSPTSYLSGGIWAGSSKDFLMTMKLPSILRSMEMGTLQTRSFPVSDTVGLAVDPTQDLLVQIDHTPGTVDFFVNLYSLNDLTPHSQADHPRFRTAPSYFPRPYTHFSFDIKIQENFLAIREIPTNSVYVPNTTFVKSFLTVWDWKTGRLYLELQGENLDGRYIHSFAFLSERLLVIASSRILYRESDSSSSAACPPSLDLYGFFQGEFQRIRSLFFPKMKYEMAEDRKLVLPRMTLSASRTVPQARSGQAAPFEQDPKRHLCLVSMSIDYKPVGQPYTGEYFNFIIHMGSILNVLPWNVGGFCDSSPLPENLAWDDWTGDGIGLFCEGYSHWEAPHWCSLSGTFGTCLHAWHIDKRPAQDDAKQVIFDYSPYSVKREKLGLNKQYPGVEVVILEPLVDKMGRIFQQTSNVLLQCVRRRSIRGGSGHWPGYALADDEHIVFEKDERSFDPESQIELQIWTM